MKKDMNKKEDSVGLVNLKDIARAVSEVSGFTITDIETVLHYAEEAVSNAIREGQSVKLYKNYKLELIKRPPKRAYDGINKVYKDLPERYAVTLKPLSMLQSAIDDLNEKITDEE